MHSNVMEKLINSIKLISFSYMYSSNKTLDRFGIEYSYIASAMGNMLKSTNNSVKNIEIDKTVSILIDWTWSCIVHILEYLGIIAGIFVGIALFELGTGGGATPLVGALFLTSLGLGIGGLVDTTYSVGVHCFGGW